MIGLPEQRVDETAAFHLCSVLNSDIRASAAFHAVPAGEFIDAEEIAVIKDEALRIFIRKAADLRLVWPDDQLCNRFDRLRAPGVHGDERITVFQTGGGHDARQGL